MMRCYQVHTPAGPATVYAISPGQACLTVARRPGMRDGRYRIGLYTMDITAGRGRRIT